MAKIKKSLKLKAQNSKWKIKVEKAKLVDGAASNHIAAVLSLGPSYYIKRLEKLGFEGKNTKLLDAGCGAGHWAIAASYLNRQVEGIDSTPKYLDYAFRINKKFKRSNLKFSLGKIEKLPFKNNSFDYIVCFNSWMYTKKELSLKEFYRILKPGGKLYLGEIAGLGWYLNLIFQGFRENKKYLVWESLKAIKRGVHTFPDKAQSMLKKTGFKIKESGSEGSVGIKNIKVKSLAPYKKYGFVNVYEILAEKYNLKGDL